jgi:hypothetical protein
MNQFPGSRYAYRWQSKIFGEILKIHIPTYLPRKGLKQSKLLSHKTSHTNTISIIEKFLLDCHGRERKRVSAMGEKTR